jgi:hypothetical protein
MKKSWAAIVACMLVAASASCAPSAAAGDGGDASAPIDSASPGAKPTCTLIAERCHDLDGVEPTATMCHRAVEAPNATEASCQALRAQCFAACPESADGGHSHGDGSTADGAGGGHDH